MLSESISAKPKNSPFVEPYNPGPKIVWKCKEDSPFAPPHLLLEDHCYFLMITLDLPISPGGTAG
ncbi:hypothetical protein Ljor_0568 [Legionella jordanis]|uniref:Uncharacterized protein n=1 Tax=Legionella jordanis TaxID=456 RepID=A0A0W0V8R0_9GAMM|nr:hypothetical protein Ljor_0568 [Legionella jordanis]